MLILTPKTWDDYQLLDSGDGLKLERFGEYRLTRPDPQIIWRTRLPKSEWQKVDATFERTTQDKGKWVVHTKVPDRWVLKHHGLNFYCKLSPFKHTGVFPEQSAHWNEVTRAVLSAVEGPHSKQPNILNLFGYTGIASLTAAAAGAKVTHVDASYPTIGWARDNQKLSGLEEKPIRWIQDDCLKFCERESRRGVKYDGIIMDPPAYGHGPNGETWEFNRSLPRLISICKQVLTDHPLLVIINAYAISTSAITLENILQELTEGRGGTVDSGELALKETASNGRLLSTGIFARWSS